MTFFMKVDAYVVYHIRRNQGANYVDSIVNNFRHILLFITSGLQRTTSWKKKTQLS
jgi:hypothetical protein